MSKSNTYDILLYFLSYFFSQYGAEIPWEVPFLEKCIVSSYLWKQMFVFCWFQRTGAHNIRGTCHSPPSYTIYGCHSEEKKYFAVIYIYIYMLLDCCMVTNNKWPLTVERPFTVDIFFTYMAQNCTFTKWVHFAYSGMCWCHAYTVYPNKYAHGFVVLCFVVVM